ncbi:serine/threonine-protein phosphatase [Clostridiales bacterium COT073_COT-073]|nr:serine/threonine-protein phosphatase [Clostridiales bacterium COT073_COT-073]
MGISFWFFADSDIGAKRKNNQDSILFLSGQESDRQLGLAVVADGMGGLADGEMASQMVIAGFEQWWYQQMPDCISENMPWKAISDSIDHCIWQINEQICDYSEQKGAAMGTTLTLAFLLDKQVLIKNIGDSRGYFVREHELSQFTRDDSYQQQFRDVGYSEQDLQEQGIAQNILTKCLGGTRNITADSQMLWLHHDILLCSDGVYQYIAPEHLADFLQAMTLDSENQYRKKIKTEIYHNGAGDNWSYIYIKKME